MTVESAVDELSFKWDFPAKLYIDSLVESGFTFSSRKAHYEHQRERLDIVVMHQNYPNWIKMYHDEG